jgi:hypothetical protein
MIGSPLKPISAQSAQSHDWDARATEVIAEARKMPLGQQRSDALGELSMKCCSLLLHCGQANVRKS